MNFFKNGFFFLLLFTTINCYAGVKIVTESVDHSDNLKTSGVILIDGDKVRVDIDLEGGQTIIYDLAKKEVVIVNHQEKTWIKLTKKQIDESRALIKKQMEAIMQQQEALLQSLPPEQREMVAAQMKEIAGSTKAVEVKYQKTSKLGKWNNMDCQIYDGMVDNKKVEELCTVVPKKIQCSIVEIERLKQISTDFAVNDYQDGVSAWNNIKELGVPVIQKSIENGKIAITNTLVSFEKTKVSVDKFKVPEGYKEITMPTMEKTPPVKK